MGWWEDLQADINSTVGGMTPLDWINVAAGAATGGPLAAGAGFIGPYLREKYGDFLTGETAKQNVAKAGQEQVAAIEQGKGEVAAGTKQATGYLAPYGEAGGRSVEAQQALMGLLGPEAQKAAIEQLQAGPEFQAMLQQGEQAILQNAAATGGLRGGNTQAMLAQFRPQLLAQLINQQYGRLAGLTGTGLSAAGGQANTAMQGAGLQAGLSSDIGAAKAGVITGQNAIDLANRGLFFDAATGLLKAGARALPGMVAGPAGMAAGAAAG